MSARAKRRSLRASLLILLLLFAAGCFFLAAQTISGKNLYELGLPPQVARLFETENRSADTSLEFTVIDVGQGSSALLQTGKSAVLIDCGESSASPALLEELTQRGVKRLDTLILTHLHTDHYGGAIRLLESVEVGEIIMPDTPEELVPTLSSFEELLSLIEKRSIPVTFINEPETRELGKSVSLSFLDSFLPSPDDLNNTSLVIRADCGGTSFLITGDAEVEIEDRLREQNEPIDVDILVAGHHGSATSSRQYFLNTVTPVASAVSVGYNNSYGLPDDTVIKRLAAFGPVYRTDINGSITFATDGSTTRVAADHIDGTLQTGGF